MHTVGKMFVSLVAALSVAVGAAQAQKAAAVDPARIAAAKELMDAAGSSKQFDAAMPMMSAQIENMFIQIAPKHEKEIRDVFRSLMARFASRKQELMDQVAVVYAERFEAAEMQEVTRFFRSGIGVKFVAAQPELMQKSMLLGQRWGERIGRELEAEVRSELKKRGIQI